jgi:hypothetical protein
MCSLQPWLKAGVGSNGRGDARFPSARPSSSTCHVDLTTKEFLCYEMNRRLRDCRSAYNRNPTGAQTCRKQGEPWNISRYLAWLSLR